MTLHGLLLPIRRSFDQYVCLRPNILYEGIQSPLRDKAAGSIDLVVVRENTEGEYTDMGGGVYHETPQEVSIQTAVFTRQGTERIIRYAFELAQRRAGRRKVTSVTKSNAMRHSMVFWDRVFREVATEYPKVEADSLLVDAASMNLVRKAQAAAGIRTAVETTLAQGRLLTPDLGGTAATSQVGDEIARLVG